MSVSCVSRIGTPCPRRGQRGTCYSVPPVDRSRSKQELGWVSAASNAANGASTKAVLRVSASFMLAMLPFDRSDRESLAVVDAHPNIEPQSDQSDLHRLLGAGTVIPRRQSMKQKRCDSRCARINQRQVRITFLLRIDVHQNEQSRRHNRG